VCLANEKEFSYTESTCQVQQMDKEQQKHKQHHNQNKIKENTLEICFGLLYLVFCYVLVGVCLVGEKKEIILTRKERMRLIPKHQINLIKLF